MFGKKKRTDGYDGEDFRDPGENLPEGYAPGEEMDPDETVYEEYAPEEAPPAYCPAKSPNNDLKKSEKPLMPEKSVY